MKALLEVSLTVSYAERGPVLRNLELTIGAGEIVGLAGMSGSGKSTLALAILRLLERGRVKVSGRIRFRGEDLLAMPEKRLRQIRGQEISLVLQSAQASLNPRMRIGAQLREAWQVHRGRQGDWRSRALEALESVSLPGADVLLDRLPSELSVGMAQRVLIAMAVMHRPLLLVADEATSALDVITQAEILGLLRRLNALFGTSVLFITHDLGAAASLCHRIAVLHEGKIVETASPADLLENPRHSYTRRLVAAQPLLPGAVSGSSALIHSPSSV